MQSRRAPFLGVVYGVLACACTSAGAPLDLEFPESDDDIVESDVQAELEAPPDEDEPEPAPTQASELCSAHTTPSEAVEVTDADDPRGGRLLTPTSDGRVLELPLQHTSFDSIVVGTVAETTVTQRFGNPLDEPIEVIYTFPLPHDGAVDDYWLRVGKRKIRGEIHRRQKATEIYDKAKKKGQSAGLLTQERPNIFTQHVANVGPHEAIEVSMHVVQPLRPSHGRYELVLPTVVGPRYIPGSPSGTSTGTGMAADTDVVPDASRITPPIIPPGYRSCGDLEIDVSIDAGTPIADVATTSHRIAVEPDHLGAMVHLDERFSLLNRDFVLSWRRDGDEPTATMHAQPDDDGHGGYFTLTIQPPTSVDPDDVPAREIVFVVDASGSMSGAPMDLAKNTMRRFIGGLGPDDAFQVIRFSESASGLGDELLEATPDNVSAAIDYVDALAGQGGTAMIEGVRAALTMPHRSDRLRYVVFLTDGYIGNETEIFELITKEIGDARLLSLGVGRSVNRYLLDGMARMGRGSVTYVDLEQPTAPVVDRIYEKVRQPALVDLSVQVKGLRVSDMIPEPLPDLFVGEPVVLFGRYEGRLRGTMTVHGRQGDRTLDVPVTLQAVRDEDTEGVRSMWARQQIDALEFDPTMAYASQARRDAVEQEVTTLSLEHRVLTQYTAFVAVDHTRNIQGRSRGKTIVQGVDMASGVAHESAWGYVGRPPGSRDGSDGLGLVGTGRGGGGSGAGSIGLGNTGTIGKGGGGGSGAGYGYGQGSGVGFGGRGKRAPRLRRFPVTVKGAMDTHIIRRIVRAHHNEVRHCYNEGLINDPKLAGRVVIQFVIDALGRVSTAVVARSTVPDEDVGNCIARAAKRWKFPKARDGGTAVVTYPFVLSTE